MTQSRLIEASVNAWMFVGVAGGERSIGASDDVLFCCSRRETWRWPRT
jgi:hypothetical protein